MIRALFTATHGMIIQERKQTTISNNLANADTTGYKAQDLFSKEMNKAMIFTMDKTETGKYVRNEIGLLNLGSEVDEIYFNFEQGMLQDTGKETDFALEGEGFLKVQWGNDVGYTRNGNFRTDGEGYLVMQDGSTRLLGINAATGQQEPVWVGNQEITVNIQGEMFLDGNPAYQLEIVTIQPDVDIQSIGNSIFTVPAGNEMPAEGTMLYQSKLERSNVNVINEMVKMIETSRSYESGQRILTALDNSLGRVVTEVGRVR